MSLFSLSHKQKEKRKRKTRFFSNFTCVVFFLRHVFASGQGQKKEIKYNKNENAVKTLTGTSFGEKDLYLSRMCTENSK